MKRKYLKWVLRLNRNSPNYILTEERKCEEISNMAVNRAMKKKIRKSDKKLVKEYIKEIEMMEGK